MMRLATIALTLSLATTAYAQGPKPSARPVDTHVVHEPSQDADSELAKAKLLVKRAKARKTTARAKAASAKATKALARASRRAERALAKARKAQAYEECVDERGDGEGAEEICADEGEE